MGDATADWQRNTLANPAVRIRVGQVTWHALGRAVRRDENPVARAMLREKYASVTDSLEDWAERATPLAFDLGAADPWPPYDP